MLGDLVSVMSSSGMELEPIEELEIVPGEQVESAFYLHLEVEDRPGVLGEIAKILGEHVVSVKSVVQKELGEKARLVMVMHPVAEGRFTDALDADLEARVPALGTEDDSRDRGGVRVVTRAGSDLAGTAGRARVPLIERYREWLPVDARTPVVTLLEGSTPLVAAPRLSERIGIETYLKIEGMNPTGSFKDRGMTVAVSQAKAAGAEAIICASTGNTAASTAAYAARAGRRGAVIVPEGKIAQGKLAQALDARCARDRAARQLRPGARARQDRSSNATRSSSSTRSTPTGSRGRRRPRSRSATSSARRPDALAIPVGNAGNITAWWKGFEEYGRGGRASSDFRPRAPRRSCWASAVERPETVASAIRIGNPARWQEAVVALEESGGRIAVGHRRARSWRHRDGWRRTRASSASRRRQRRLRVC